MYNRKFSFAAGDYLDITVREEQRCNLSRSIKRTIFTFANLTSLFILVFVDRSGNSLPLFLPSVFQRSVWSNLAEYSLPSYEPKILGFVSKARLPCSSFVQLV